MRRTARLEHIGRVNADQPYGERRLRQDTDQVAPDQLTDLRPASQRHQSELLSPRALEPLRPRTLASFRAP
jgi:hypothetical protein